MMNLQSIRPGMAVFGSCGNRLGTVDNVEDDLIKLRRNGPGADGYNHCIPFEWVQRVENDIHLNLDCAHARDEWTTEVVEVGV